MKHLLNGILASSLILSMGSITFASELTETQNISVDTEILQEIETKTLSSMSPEVASAYAGVIENIISKYGENQGEDRDTDETEFIMGHLIDFDGDGTDELYVSYISDMDHDDVWNMGIPGYKTVTEEIWAYTASGLKQVWTNETELWWIGNNSASDGTVFIPHGDKILLLVYSGYAGNYYGYRHTIYEYSNGAMKVQEELSSSCYWHDGLILTINGVENTIEADDMEAAYALSNLYGTFNVLSLSDENYDMSKLQNIGYMEGRSLFWDYANPLPQLQAIASQPSTKTATPSTAKVMVNGKEVNFGAYNIDGFNFYKLTDMSFALNGTGKQFEVTWDGTAGAINMKIGSPHIILGSELQGTSGADKIAEEMDVKVLKNSALVNDLIVYSIDGSSYFQLDKLKGVLGIDVGWDGTTSTITITT